MEQFLRSAVRYDLHLRHRFIVYDLGLEARQLELLRRCHPWCEFRPFDFSRHPAHVALEAGHYAWKPVIVADLLDECGGQVVWFDSATLLHADLEELQTQVARFGTYTLAGQSALSRRCDPLTLQAMAVPPAILHQPERVAGVVGFDAAHPAALHIARAWREHALIESHIAPRSPRYDWHNPEQAVLSVLLLKAQFAGELELNPGEIDISSTRPVRWMTSRNKLPDWLPRWADPLARACYGSYKRLDQLALRFERGFIPAWDGLLRLPHDHYRLRVSREGGEPVVVRSPWSGYWADPFVWHHDGRTWLLVEEYEYLKSRGRLLALELDEALQVCRQVQPLAFAHHVSFPFLFEQQGRLYMVPETHRADCVDLYLCEAFPDRWQRAQRLLRNVDAADSVVFFHDDRWWMISSLWEAGDSRRYLGIFWSFDLLAPDWTAHPVNRERRYHGAGRSSLRNAGPIVAHEGALLRPVQVNPHYYGESLSVMRIERLNQDEFSESPYHGGHPFRAIADRYPAHHVSQHGGVVAWDSRDRVSYARTLAALLRPE